MFAQFNAMVVNFADKAETVAGEADRLEEQVGLQDAHAPSHVRYVVS